LLACIIAPLPKISKGFFALSNNFIAL